MQRILDDLANGIYERWEELGLADRIQPVDWKNTIIERLNKKMKNIKVGFDTWIQLLGMVGVLGGLVFVGLEMQQTQNIAIAGQVQGTEMALTIFYLRLWKWLGCHAAL